jgi:formate dehydrogenase subunit delta
MDTDNLVNMANRIGDFFDSMPDRKEARYDIADHIRKFWEPRMRRQFLAAFDAGDTELKPIVHEAVVEHRSMLD